MTEHAEQQVFRLLYRSHDRLTAGDRRAALGALFTQARSNNKARSITGALLLGDGAFVQMLEGDEAAVGVLFERIARDPRHDTVTLLESGPAPARLFARWAMAEVSGDRDTDIPLIAGRGGITEAGALRTTPEQEAALEVMRAAARVDASAR